MISIADGALRWGREDVRLMAKIIGAEHAVISLKQKYRSCPMLASILKVAHAKGGLLSPRAESLLRDAERKHARIEKIKQWEDAEIDDPKARKYFSHQRADLGFLYTVEPSGALIASEAGVGKTLLGIRYPEHLNAQRNLLACPNTAKEQWRDEIRRWSSNRLPVRIVEGNTKQQARIILRDKPGWIITHPESFVHVRDALVDVAWDMAVIDEAHLFGNRNAQRTDTLHHLTATWRMAMTAHPYANSTSELWSILRFLYPKIYTSFWRWAGLHIHIDEAPFGGLDLRVPRRPKLLQWELAPFTIRRMWRDVRKNLPPITRVQRTAHLTSRGAAEYKKLKKQFFASLSSIDDAKNIWAIPSPLARVTRLRQYLIDPDILGSTVPSVKYPVVLDIMDEVNVPVVVFSMYREAAMRLRRYLVKHKKRVAVIVGGMVKQVNPIKKQFLRGKYDAVIILISVGGTSLNFGKYGKLIYLDMPWNQRDVEQTEGRVQRPEEGTGTMVACTSYHIVVADSYEEKMQVTRHDKHENFSMVFTVAQARELFDED